MVKKEMELEKLTGKVFKMSKNVLKMMDEMKAALMERDTEKANKVINNDDRIDAMDNEIDRLTTRMLALYEPKAKELRIVVTALSIIRDLERSADHVVDISKEIIKLNEVEQVKPYIDLPVMIDTAKEMLENALASYFDKDVFTAIDVIKMDDKVDELNEKIITELMNMLSENDVQNMCIVSLIYISRSIERIADLATDIAELSYFIVKSRRIKHDYEELSKEMLDTDEEE